MSDVNEGSNHDETQGPAASSPDETDLAGNPVGGEAGAGDESDEGVEGAGQERDGAGTGDESGGSVEAPPIVAAPRAIEELRKLALGSLTDEELDLVDADLGDPDAEGQSLGRRIESLNAEKLDLLKAIDKEIGEVREKLEKGFEGRQRRLRQRIDVNAERSRRKAIAEEAVRLKANPPATFVAKDAAKDAIKS